MSILFWDFLPTILAEFSTGKSRQISLTALDKL